MTTVDRPAGPDLVVVPVPAQAEPPPPPAPRPSAALPVTATGTGDRNVAGQVLAITVFSTVRWWGRAFLPVLFLVTRRVPSLTGTLRRLSFIHFARWTVFRELPWNGAPQRRGRLRYPHMYFESNFNGGWEEYIDAFSHVLTDGMTAFWGSSYGYPKPLPTGPFKAYIQANEVEADHFWCAYPDATSTMVQQALRLGPELDALLAHARTDDPDAFAARYRAFLTSVQRSL